MDVTMLRRGLLAHMASGAEFIKGTFTAPSSGDSYTFNFGKAFSSYLFLVEMTDASKTALINSGKTAVRTYAFVGVYPIRSINNKAPANSVMLQRYNPSTEAADGTTITTVVLSDSSIEFPLSTINNANYMYRDYSYNYYIVKIK